MSYTILRFKKDKGGAIAGCDGKKKENIGILKSKNLKKNKENMKQDNYYMKTSYENQI